MHFKKCSKCNQEIINTFEKCPYCGAIQKENVMVYKLIFRFIIGMLIGFVYLHFFLGPKWILHPSPLHTDMQTVYLSEMGSEIVTDEYRVEAVSVDTLPPTKEQIERYGIKESEVMLEVIWTFEPLKNVRLTSSPKLVLEMHSQKDHNGSSGRAPVKLDAIEASLIKTHVDDLVRNTNIYRVEKEAVEADLLTLSIDADWHIDLSSVLKE